MQAISLTSITEPHTVTFVPQGERVRYRSYYRGRLQVENQLLELEARRIVRQLQRDGYAELNWRD